MQSSFREEFELLPITHPRPVNALVRWYASVSYDEKGDPTGKLSAFTYIYKDVPPYEPRGEAFKEINNYRFTVAPIISAKAKALYEIGDTVTDTLAELIHVEYNRCIKASNPDKKREPELCIVFPYDLFDVRTKTDPKGKREAQ